MYRFGIAGVFIVVGGGGGGGGGEARAVYVYIP